MRRFLLAAFAAFALAAPALAAEPVIYEYSCDDVADQLPPPHPNLLAGTKKPKAAVKAEAGKDRAPVKKRVAADVRN